MNVYEDIRNNNPYIQIYENHDKLIIYNTVTLKKIFTTKKEYVSGKIDLSKVYKNQIILEKPVIDTYRVEVTFRCNLNCDYCIVNKNSIKDKNTHMDMDTAKRITKEFNENNINNLLIMGGEPLLNWEITKYFIENVKGYKTIVTNGTLINEEVAQILSREDCLVIVSMDGMKEKFNKHRYFNTQGSIFEKVKRGYNICKENGCKMGIFSVANKYNCDNLADVIYEMINKLNPQVVGINFPHYTSFADLDIDPKAYAKQIINLYNLTKNLEVDILQINRRLNPLINERFNLMSCNVAGKQKTFYPNGKVTLCAKFDGVNKGNGIDSSFFMERLPIYNSNCHKCDAIGICGGGCPWDAANRWPNELIDKEACILTKLLLKEYLWDRYEQEYEKHNI